MCRFRHQTSVAADTMMPEHKLVEVAFRSLLGLAVAVSGERLEAS